MSDHRTAALQYASSHHDGFLAALEEFVAIESISTDPGHVPGIRRAAEWVVGLLDGLGVEHLEIHPTAGHPVVYGDWLHLKGSPTLLIYGHYDVQPVDPIELWSSPPFVGTLRGEHIFGRGVSDMKGQIIALTSALESLARTGTFPINMKFLIEGEEEIGSPSLDRFIAEHKDLLRCDLALNMDSGINGPEIPSITYALRGLAYFELRIIGPSGDLHSGMYGGAVHNPAVVLSELLAGMHDREGRVTLPGFYDKVLPLTAEEREEFARQTTAEDEFLQLSGAPALFGEAGYSAAERVGGRPTLEINGLLSGFTGAGAKTVIPAQAMAKISTRLVPDQHPAEVETQLRTYLSAHAPGTVRWELITMAGSPASISQLDNPGVSALARALEETWGSRPLFRREGGSVPVVGQLKNQLGVESVMAGFGLPDDNLHAPNEKLHLPTWYRGIEAMVRFFFNLDW